MKLSETTKKKHLRRDERGRPKLKGSSCELKKQSGLGEKGSRRLNFKKVRRGIEFLPQIAKEGGWGGK